MKTYYKCKLIPSELGLEIITDEWVSIKETPCYHYCISKFNYGIFKNATNPYEAAKKRNAVKRVHKTNSRFAFPTKEEALDHLRMLKIKQLAHFERETALINAFIQSEEIKDLDHDVQVVPNTSELVSSYYVFD